MYRVKICGITNEEDALSAIEKGAFAIGFIFYPKSPRYIPPVKASQIIRKIPPFIGRVGVFVNMDIRGIFEIMKRVGLSAVQLHGDESPEFCYELKTLSSIPIIKVFRIKDESSLNNIKKYSYTVNAILLDTHKDKVYGGTGETFDWNLAKKARNYNIPLILSGGLNPQNIKEAYDIVKPYAFDVNSGIELTPGIKDHTKMDLFFRKLHQAEQDKN